MKKNTVTLTATSVKTFDVNAHNVDEAIAIVNDIRDHTEMLNFTEMDVSELTTTAEPAVSEEPQMDAYDDDEDGDDIIVEQIHTAASDMRFALQLLLDSVDSLEL